MSPRLKAYVTATVVAAVAVLAIGWPHAFTRDWGHYVAWVVICLVSETLWNNTISGGATISLSATVGLSSTVLWGAGAGLWISAFSTFIADLFVLRKPLVRVAFNSAQVALATAVGAIVFQLLGGRVALPVAAGGAVLDRAHATSLMLPFAGLVVGYFIVNRAMVALAVAWSAGRGFRQVLMEDWLYMARIEVDAASFLLTPLMVISFTTVGYPGVLLFYAPLFMLFQSDRRYLELKRAEEVNLRNARFAAKGELAAGIGHELNNQLVAISARALVHAIRSAGLASARTGGVDSTKMIGRAVRAAMSLTIASVKLPEDDDAPINIVGITWRTTSASPMPPACKSCFHPLLSAAGRA